MNLSDNSGRDDRVELIRDLILQLAAGRLQTRVPQSEAGDDLDAVIVGLNMLAEELAARTAAHEATLESLRCSEERFQLAMAGANDGLWDWNPQSDRTYYSPRWKSMLGYADTELSDAPAEWEERLHPEDRARVKAELRDNVEGRKEHYESIYRLRHRKGHWVWVLGRGRTFYDAQGRPVRVVGTHVDISEQKRLEAALQQARDELERRVEARTRALSESEARWRSLVESAPDYVLTVDPALRITFMNRPVPGTTLEELVGRDILETVAEADRQLVRDELLTVLRTSEPTQFEIHGIGPQSASSWFAVQVGPVVHGETVTALVISGRDVTERRAMVQALKDSEAKYRYLWESLHDAAFIADATTGILLETNRRGEELTGRPRSDIVGSHQSTLYPAERANSSMEAFHRHIAEGGIVYDQEVQRADGTIARVDISVVTTDINGRRLALGLFHDVTERHRMVEALRASESKYRLLWDNLNDAAFIIDAESGVVVETNSTAEQLVGRPREAIVGQPHTGLYPAHLRDTYRQTLRDQDEMERVNVYDCEVACSDGSVIPVDISAAAMEIGGKRLVLGLFHDITRRKAMMRDLEFMQFAIDHADDAIFWMDDDLRLLHVNEAACDSLGYQHHELTSLCLADIAPNFTGAVKVTLCRRRDGTTFPVEITANRFRYEDRNFVCAIARDVTDRQHTEQRILERDANLQALAENANDGILVTLEGHFVFANRRFADLIGYSVDELIGRSCLEFVHSDERARIHSLLQARLEQREAPTQYETVLLCREGANMPVEVTAARTVWNGDAGLMIIVRDVSARKRWEAMLERNAAALAAKSMDLEQVNLELQQIIYVMAHDLKAPLRAVSQLATILEEELGAIPQEPARLLSILRGRVQRMHGLIEALLAYSRAGQEARVEEVDCLALLEGIVADIAIPAAYAVDLASDLPALFTDAMQLRQVFANLLNNAVVHHDRPEGRIHVCSSDAGEFVRFEVRDDGPGIPTEYQERIFEMFQTLGRERDPTASGMGLALVKKLVEGKGGSIGVQSTGRGAAFRFTWPRWHGTR